MNNAIFVLNAGSSSLKFSIYGVADQDMNLVARGEIEGLGLSAHFKVKDGRGQTLADASLGDSTRSFGHSEAFTHLAHWAYETFSDELVPLAVGHRVVHGGLTFSEPTLIDAGVVTRLEQLIPLMPLHQAINLNAIKAVMRLWPDLPQLACFDTAFHRGRAPVTERFGLPEELFCRGLRRWGFHGLSYECIEKRAITYFGVLLILAGGVFSYLQLGQLEDPEFTVKTAAIVTAYPGASAEQVELEITDRIETKLQEMTELKNVYSNSRPGLSIIKVDIKSKYWSDRLPQVWDVLRKKVQDVKSSLPPGAGEPIVLDDFGYVFGFLLAASAFRSWRRSTTRSGAAGPACREMTWREPHSGPPTASWSVSIGSRTI